MIARLVGRLARKSPQQVLVDVGGVGYRVQVSLATFYALPDEETQVCLETYTVVREDAIHLFGFRDLREKAIFEKLITVSKIGPKLALNILSGIETGALFEAIADGDVDRLATVPGVGVKTAERMVVELRDKIAALDAATPRGEAPAGRPGTGSGTAGDAAAALVNLGYRRKEAEKAVAKAGREGAEGLEELIRRALSILSG